MKLKRTLESVQPPLLVMGCGCSGEGAATGLGGGWEPCTGELLDLCASCLDPPPQGEPRTQGCQEAQGGQ